MQKYNKPAGGRDMQGGWRVSSEEKEVAEEEFVSQHSHGG